MRLFLWLDDVRWPPDDNHGWTVCRTVAEAIHEVEMDMACGDVFWCCSLDHDLGDGHDGIEFVNWMRDENIWPRLRPIIHSMNPVGRQNMEFVIQRYWDAEIPL